MATVDVTTAPLYLTGRSGVYGGHALRQPFGDLVTAGVADSASFAVGPRGAGVNMSVDVGSASALNLAYVSGSDVSDQGAYRIGYLGATLNVPIAANASGNPRVDTLVLRIADAEHAGTDNKAYLDVVQGSPTSGATLDNRSGHGALPASCIALADVLVASGASAITVSAIRDLRPRARVGSARVLAGEAGDMKLSFRTDPHSGWLLCDGSQADRFLYADLFAAIGTTHGAGDGSTTFTLPDCRGRDFVGAGTAPTLTNRPLGSKFGEESHVLSVAEMPSHNHPGSTGRISITRSAPDGSLAEAGDLTGTVQDTQVLTIAAQGGGGAHNNMQPSIAVNAFIRV
jgi:microcystin-dependent protein